MRRLFVVGVIGLLVAEVANVYFIMPMPGSQQMRSIDAAYTLYKWRWLLRALFGALLVVGLPSVWRLGGWRRGAAAASLVLVAFVTYAVNFQMSADHMFRQPSVVNMQPVSHNKVALNRLVVGLAINGDARAYPLQFIGYHHQVIDSVAGRRVLVSYCTVCRTGRVFAPVIAGRTETFRLVGMDHFNAMLEDQTTGSWWRQANGEAITGTLKGTKLPELPMVQVTLRQWLAMYPNSLIMQGDPAFTDEYAKDYAYERGWSRKKLTGTDTASWKDKSWVVGIEVNGTSRAYDWNRLNRERIVNDTLGGAPVVVLLGPDSLSYFAFRRPSEATRFALRGDSLVADGRSYALSGQGATGTLQPLNASQEFWHSWRTFQPATGRY
ncbi:MAG: hypothetical protein JWM95_5553 [Gemmatimonadetes bacterium]|nr:hypothetical protein [Gemmatimonadota bacterium]